MSISAANSRGAGTDAKNRCTPNTLYRQFAIAGINLNSSPLSNLPIITNQNIADIAGALGFTPSPFVGAQVIAFAPDYKNPRAVQFGGGVEREISRGLVVGVDYANVSTHRIGRFRDLNLPAPLTGAQYVAYLTANNSAANVATNSFVSPHRNSAASAVVRQLTRTFCRFAILQPARFRLPM